MSVRSAPAFLDRYGYREIERSSYGVWPTLELRFDRRRADWLPIPKERLRVENARGEEVARMRSDAEPPLTGSFWTRLKVQTSGTGVELTWLGERRLFHRDTEGVLVPEGTLPEVERPPEEAYRGFDGLRLVPDPE